jgi:hypothetical protein
MPTGYTSTIKDGISFENFAIKCARNFGACIALRDESSDVLPTIDNIKFENNDYHQKQLEEAKSELLYCETCSDQDWKISFHKHLKTLFSHHKREISKSKKLLTQYNEMLAKVEDWIPPTHDHVELKKFMKNQLIVSIDHDCDISYHEDALISAAKLTLREYKENKMKTAKYNVSYRSREIKLDKQRNSKHVEWLKKLLDSLKKWRNQYQKI